MAKPTQRRALRNYRNATPTTFHRINQKVRKALEDNEKIPESIWVSNPTLLAKYFAGSDKHDVVYHDSLLEGGKSRLSQRELLQAQLTEYLDEIALILETAAIRNPDILVFSGFDLAKERRTGTRRKVPTSVEESSDHHEAPQ